MAAARPPAAALLLCGLGLRSAAALPTPTADPSSTATAAAGGGAAGSPAAAAGGHGILFLFSDEMDGRIHDPASPQTKPPMPNLQKLAASGALFTTACEQQPLPSRRTVMERLHCCLCSRSLSVFFRLKKKRLRTDSQSPQCVPSRSAMMVGKRTDQIEVYDNFVGIAGVNGDPNNSDPYCAHEFGHAACVEFAKTQKAPPAFIDRLSSAGYNVSLWGKVHVGAGLSEYPGAINAFPFTAGTSAKALREWTRGLVRAPLPSAPSRPLYFAVLRPPPQSHVRAS
eukprot:COSAG04_NODE_1317_length_7248_cov_10.699119_9_plen_283_part_00